MVSISREHWKERTNKRTNEHCASCARKSTLHEKRLLGFFSQSTDDVCDGVNSDVSHGRPSAFRNLADKTSVKAAQNAHMRLARQRLRTPKSDRPTRILSFWAAKLSRFSSTRAAVTVVNTRYDQIGTVTDSDAILPQTTSVGWQTKDQTIRRLDGADRCKTDGRRKTSSL